MKPLTDRAKASREPHLGLITAVARKYARIAERVGLEFEDLLQEGRIAVMRAEQLYDPALGKPFGSYAAVAIRHKIQKAIADASLIKIWKPKQQLPEYQHLRYAESLDSPWGDDRTLLDVLDSGACSPEDEVIQGDTAYQLKTDVRAAILRLKESQQAVVRGMMQDATPRQTAVSLGKSHQRAYQLWHAAREKLARSLGRSQAVRDCLDK